VLVYIIKSGLQLNFINESNKDSTHKFHPNLFV